MILILSADEDCHAAAVAQALAASGAEALILDTREFPLESELAMEFATLTDERVLHYRSKTIDLKEIGVVWWRRPQPYQISAEIHNPDVDKFVFQECDEAIQGLWLTLEATWVNPPENDERAARKGWQLELARQCQLQIPRTLITNNPKAAQKFINSEGIENTIYKAFQGNEGAWRETRLLKPDELTFLDSVRHAPVIFQEYIEATLDLRVTIIGSKIFAAAIHSQQCDYKVDFRMDMKKTRITPHTLPRSIELSLLKLMKRLGLVYGAVDLRLRPDGSYVFLEINPAGQWLFIEDATGQSITQCLAKYMAEKDAFANENMESSEMSPFQGGCNTAIAD